MKQWDDQNYIRRTKMFVYIEQIFVFCGYNCMQKKYGDTHSKWELFKSDGIRAVKYTQRMQHIF